MGDVVNLNAYRKRQEREAMKDRAAENRARHGRKRVEKARIDADRDRAAARHEGSKLERDSNRESED